MRNAPIGSVFAILLAVGATSPLTAHGGMYRGPGPAPIIGPGTGGPGAGPSGPNTGPASTAAAGVTSWQFWWEFNKAHYLRLRDSVRDPGSVAGLVETTQRARATLAPSDAEKRELILPALDRLLSSTDSPDIATACMIAMAKIGFDHPEVSILPVFRRHLARGNQEVRETAALCFGISRRLDAIEDLAELALDTERGRRAVGRSTVDERTRAFAIYGLGLIARHGPTPTKNGVYEVLAGLLRNRDVTDRDVRVALIQSLGQLRLDAAVATEKRLLWQCLELLWADYDRDIGKADQITQAHIPTSIARLLGRGASPDHERAKERLIVELAPNVRRQACIVQSAALALGRLALPPESHEPDAAVHDALREYAEDGKDEQARYFSLIALGEIGGSKNRDELIRFYRRGGKATVRPWAAIALGVLAHEARMSDPAGTVDVVIGRVLHEGLREVENDEHRSATAVAVGLCGYDKASKDMIRFVEKYRRHDTIGGYTCIGLALLGDTAAIEPIRELVGKSVRRPLLLNFAAIALAKLGDKHAIELLLELIGDGDANLAKLASIASAFGYIGDRRAVAPLVDLMFDDDMTKLSRAFVAAALGNMSDPFDLPWNADLASGTNYQAAVVTLSNGSTGVLDIL